MTTLWTTVLAIGSATILVGVGAAIGRWSRRDEIDELEARLAGHEAEIAKHIGYEDDCERAIDDMRKRYRQIEEDLTRERAVSDHLRRELGRRRIGATPLWAQTVAVEPAPIDKAWLRYETGTWPTIPAGVSRALELHIGVHRQGVSRQPGRHATDYRTAGTWNRDELAAMVDEAHEAVPA